MIVLIATDWSTSSGGISAFNLGLACALARSRRGSVACAVTNLDAAAQQRAERDGVRLIAVRGTADGKPTLSCGRAVLKALRASGEAETAALWIGHDLVTGEAAAAAQREHGGALALIHHMDYQSYQNFAGDRGDAATRNHRRQIKLFANPAATLFGVGSWLKANVERLADREAHLLVPGFPATRGVKARAASDALQVVAAGRFGENTEPLKRISVAVEGFAEAVRRWKDSVPLLERPTLTILGVQDGDAQRELHRRAEAAAGCPVNVVLAGFDSDPDAVAELASRAHLVVVPSRHEGFGLVGWEAIGTGTPLILGRGAGLAHQLSTTLDGQAEGLVHILALDGSDGDVDAVARAIMEVARDVPKALRRAAKLRDRLASELGGSWGDAANDVLAATGLGQGSPARRQSVPTSSRRDSSFRDCAENHFPRCVELALSAGQGSSPQSLELIAQLRFGVTELEVDGIEAELSLDRATVEVKPRRGKLARSDRLGEGTRTVPGVEARAGGVWLLNNPDGGPLVRRALGDESLCVVEASTADAVSVDVEVTAARRDIRCDIRVPRRRLAQSTEKVMGVFLKDRLWKEESGHVVLSTASLSEAEND